MVSMVLLRHFNPSWRRHATVSDTPSIILSTLAQSVIRNYDKPSKQSGASSVEL